MIRLFFVLFFLAFCLHILRAGGRELPNPYVSESSYSKQDTIPYKNRPGSNPERDKKNPFDLKDPKSIDKEVDYNPETGEYTIKEKIGSDYYSNPSNMTFDEYMAYKSRQQDLAYYKNKTGVSTTKSRFNTTVDPLKKLDLKKNLSDRLFGGLGIQIEPRGNIDLFLGGFYNFNDNPSLSQRQKYQYGPDFDMKIQMEVTGSIGDKLKLNTNYNTQSSFDFDNKLKLAYDSEKFTEDDIVKKIEAGNVALPLRSTLIKGSQNLFGFKTDWQFGHLKLTGLLAQQRAKNENITTKGGGVYQEFELRPDQFDENRHFFLSHYCRDSYEPALSTLPEINSQFRIKDIEVWITEDGQNSRETNIRDIVALADIGTPEGEPFDMGDVKSQNFTSGVITPKDLSGRSLVTNGSNTLLKQILATTDARDLNKVVSTLTNQFGLIQGQDFEKVRAKRLNPTEYTYNAELGFISLRIRPRPNQVLAVSYHYTYNGRDEDQRTGNKFKVGEFSSDVKSDSLNFKVLFVKLLKSSNQVTTLPSYDLMMKNVYSVGGFNLSQEGFTFDIFYESPKGIQQRFVDDPNLDGYPLLNLFKLDNLNKTSDPQPDGIFDWIPGQTVVPQSGSVIFPVLEPFGKSMNALIFKALGPNRSQAVADEIYKKYQYEFLYDSSITKARQRLSGNQFLLKGTYKAGKSNEIALNTFGSDPNSKIIVRAGSLVLTENVDYIVDRNQGKVTILNESLLTGGANISVDFENNSLFNIQTRSMVGFRAEYAKSKDFYLGATYMNLFERPFTQKVNLGEDPINNKVFGVDVGYTKSAPWMTRALDALPSYSTKESSKISLQAEAAYLKPGYSKAIDQKGSTGGVIYIDDFEGSSSGIGLSYNPTQWILASVPVSKELSANFLGNDDRNNRFTSSNRALLSWYRIDPFARNDAPDAANSYSRLVDETEIFPNRQRPLGFSQELTFDLSYFPSEKGPYNYDVPNGLVGSSSQATKGVDANNRLNSPETRWAGIMTKLNTNDFEIANIEYIDFWLLNPYLAKYNDNNISNPGKLFLQLGSFSEDILKDGIGQFENGLPTKNLRLPTDATVFGKMSRKPPIINTFEIADREQQDVGLDGLSSSTGVENEQTFFQNDYLNLLRATLTQQAYTDVSKDPSNDDFISYRSNTFPANTTVLQKYKRNNMLEGNSQIDPNNQISTASTAIPDQEDLNYDKSLNEIESYYSYKVDLDKDANGELKSEFITESVQKTNGNVTETWYRFRIPITRHDVKVGPISDFRSIQAMRMLLTGFNQNVTLRFVKLQLGRNNWRRDSSFCAIDQSTNELILDKVDIEENSGRLPFNYVQPPGIQRQQLFGSGTTNLLANESSILMKKTNLLPNCTQTITKITELDIRRYKRFKMFVHAEDAGENVPKGDLRVFVRLGRDFANNYYEYEIPVRMSTPSNLSTKNSDSIWLAENDFDFPLKLFIDLKNSRNIQGIPFNILYTMADPDRPENVVKIIGNPNIASIRGLMIGMRNASNTEIKSAEIWVNEMRLTGIENFGGLAALARAEAQLADLGNVSVAGAYTSVGYGGIEERLDERSLEDIKQLDATTSLDLGKFIPKSIGISLPFTAQYSVATRTPEFDANDLDVKLKDKLSQTNNSTARDSIREKSIDYSATKSFAFNNVRKNRVGKSKVMPWNIENFALSYGQSSNIKHNPIVADDKQTTKKGALDYNYGRTTKYVEPFKFIKSKYLKFISEFNFNPLPNSIAIRNNLDRRQSVTVYRFAAPKYATWETVKFGWLRDYTMNWDLTKSIKINFNAQVDAVVDEITYNPLEQSYQNPLNGRLVDESEKKPFLKDNLRDFGRIKDYKHTFGVNYTLPTKLIPGLEWIQSRVQYNSNYNWASGSQRTIDTLGSVISNGQTIGINGEFNFSNLYNKWSYLKKISDDGESNSRRTPVTKGKSNAKIDPKAKLKKESTRKISLAEKVLIRPLLLVRRIQLNYTENSSTIIPGFMQRPELLGQNKDFNAPGWSFIAGLKPDIGKGGFLDEAGAKGWISNNPYFNREVIQRNTKTFGAKGKIELFKNFALDLNLDRSFTKDHTETFKFEEVFSNPGQFAYQHLTPYETGQYSISFISFQTLFNHNIDSLFDDFSTNREIFSKRIASQYNLTTPSPTNGKYIDGFTGDHQDVIINSFIASYTKKNPNTSSLDVFKTMPLPNWQFNYSGLSRLGIFKDVFQDFSIKHGYKNTLTVGSFRSNLDYKEDPFGVPITRKVDTFSNSYYSRFEIPEVSIKEAFNPLIGINIKTKKGLDLGFEINKNRDLTMKSGIEGQLEERNSTAYTFRAGYVVKNVYLSFLPGMKKVKIPKKPKKGQSVEEANAKKPKGNDLQFTCDFSLRDDISKIHRLDEGIIARTFEGAKQITFSPAVKYNLNKNLNVRFFVDYNKRIPYAITNSYKDVRINGGLTVQFLLN
ncbi:MAG: cell surface protein SprA [Saprospiraceae bacterium]